MSRPLRIEYPGAWYHVMNRGRRGENIFVDRDDYETFIALLQETSEMFELRVSVFCLMSNHYHILVQTPLANLSRAMRHINGVYTQRYNRRRNTDGQLFRGRYKSVLVQEDSHLLELLRYIHRNPVRANMCNGVGDYLWSSHREYSNSAKKWDWLHKEFLLRMFDQDPHRAKKQYKDFVQCEESAEFTNFFSRKNLTSFFGSQNFIDWVKSTYRQLQNHKEIPQSKHLTPTIDDIKRAVCEYYEIEQKHLEQTKRGQVNEARNVAVYLAREKCGLSLETIGRQFELLKYSSVSSIVTRTEKKLLEDKPLRDRIEEISQKLSKSQAKT
ncbi:transposase [Desulfopila inferna]|uniref:transposase n=1 Tax=Desulfopila inferna TaxID=468528 RepID=UPI0019659760|nr:transposase [Desulfopila inferna]MBM9606239.1 transposase [Desulfopila inferna]